MRYRLSVLFLLYFVQGAPYGFQTGCLPLILRKAGLSFRDLGIMKLLFIPWVMKPFFAARVEKRKVTWLFRSMMILGLSCWLATKTAPENVTQLSVILLMLNLFSAVQDVCVDCLAVKLLDPSELGTGNTVQIVGYKLGSTIAGGLLLWLEDTLGWEYMFAGFGLIYFICVLSLKYLGLIVSDDTDDERDQESKDVSLLDTIKKVPGSLWMIGYVLFYKLSDRAVGIYPVYLVDKGLSSDHLALGNTVTRLFSILGSAYGGYILSRQDPFKALYKFGILQVFPLLVQLILVYSWGTERIIDWNIKDVGFAYLSYVALSGALFCGGTITTATFTIMMRLSQTAAADSQGTHFSMLCTFEILGKLLFASVVGGFVDLVGLNATYLLFFILAVINIPALGTAPTSVTLFKNKNE